MIRPHNDIIQSVLDNQASRKQARVVLKWFRTPEGEQFLSSLIDEDIERIKMRELVGSSKVDVDKLYAEFERRIRRKAFRRLLFRVAAVILPLAMVSSIGLMLDSKVDIFNYSEIIEVVADGGDRIQVVFQDGSKVYLNSNSRLTYPEAFAYSSRRVQLDGEGYFEVVSNSKWPFIVSVNGADIKVTGTSFNVNAPSKSKRMSVALDQGKVDVDILNRSYSMSPDQLLTYNKETKEVVLSNNNNVDKKSIWRKNILYFDNAPMEDVINQLRSWYGVEIVVRDPKIYDYDITLITGMMTPLEQVLKELEFLAPIGYKQKDDRIIIFKK